MIKKFLSRSVTVGTAQGYMLGIRKWEEYLTFLGTDNNPGQFMEKIIGQHEKAKRVVLFMAYLYMNNGMRDEQIKKVVTSVAYLFEVEGKDATFFGNAIVSRGRKASVRSAEECSVHENIRAENTILPICLDIVLAVRRQYWENHGWDAKGMDNKGIWLAICLGFDSGLRIGNLTKKDGPNGADHCIRAGSLSFRAMDPVTKTERRIKGGPNAANFISRQDVTLSMILSVDMVYVTSKTSRKVKSLIDNPKTISRESDVESTVLDDLCLWVVHSKVQESDELLTRYSEKGGRKVVIRKDVRTAIKSAVKGVGLPPKHFSTKSLRSGFGTHAVANGMGVEEMKVRGGWVKDSDVPERFYVRNMNSRGALALSCSASGTQRHGLNEIQRMLPVETDRLGEDHDLGGA